MSDNTTRKLTTGGDIIRSDSRRTSLGVPYFAADPGHNTLYTSIDASTVVGASGWSYSCYLDVDAYGTLDLLSYGRWLFYDSTATYGLEFTTTGVRAFQFQTLLEYNTTGPSAVVELALTLGRHAIQARWTGTLLQIRVDGGAWTSIACTAIHNSGIIGPAMIGYPQNGYSPQGNQYDVLVSASSLSDADLDNVIAYYNQQGSTTLGGISASAYDPSTLALTIWGRPGKYRVGKWEGSASAGTSGVNSFNAVSQWLSVTIWPDFSPAVANLAYAKAQTMVLLTSSKGFLTDVVSRRNPLFASSNADLWEQIGDAWVKREAAMAALIERRAMSSRAAGGARPVLQFPGGTPAAVPSALPPTVLGSACFYYLGDSHVSGTWTDTISGRNAVTVATQAVPTPGTTPGGHATAIFTGTQILSSPAGTTSVLGYTLKFGCFKTSTTPGAGLEGMIWEDDPAHDSKVEFVDTGKLQSNFFHNNSTCNSNAVLTDGAWHRFIVASKDADWTTTLYIDGTAQTQTGTGFQNAIDARPLEYLGGWWDGFTQQYSFTGTIAGIGCAQKNVPFSGAEITALDNSLLAVIG